MEPGNIVEYINQQKIICAVVLEIKKQRLRLLNENNREVNLSSNRLLLQSDIRLELAMSRKNMVDTLKKTANTRQALAHRIPVRELWEILNAEQEWIDLVTMTEFCFPNEPTWDHKSAVVRAFFDDECYFKFKKDRFFPHSEEQLEQTAARHKKEAERNRIIEEGGVWLKSILNDKNLSLSQDKIEFVNILKSIYIFGKDSRYHTISKAILARAGVESIDRIFDVFVRMGVFDENENIYLHKYNITTSFSDRVQKRAAELTGSSRALSVGNGREDLTMLPLMTIDGNATLDYDDALSLEDMGNHYRLGIHIVDVGNFIKKGDAVDQEALSRGSSIYMPDRKIPMLPPQLAEETCSLKMGEWRPAISVMIKLSRTSEIIDYEIIPSVVGVKRQLTYYDVNTMADKDKEIIILHEIAKKFRQNRIAKGAIQITLPEINVSLDDDGSINVKKINRESPARMLVSELMIMANWLMAKFLAGHDTPAIFRSQTKPRGYLFKGNEGTLFQNCMQRRLLSRFALSNRPECHTGLGLDAYVTATSPIRKYFDLVTQRQVRSILGLESPYTPNELDNIIQLLEQPTSNVAAIQRNRNKYWLLKYLEKKIGQKEEALVLFKRKNSYQILLTEYMLECDLHLSFGTELKPEGLIDVTIQHADARKDVLSVFMG